MTMTQQEYSYHVNAVWKATGILALVTGFEVGMSLLYDAYLEPTGLRMGLNVLMVVATLVKAFYIVSVFMHLRYERKALALTVLMPLFFLIWFIIAFLWEGSSWHHLRVMFG